MRLLEGSGVSSVIQNLVLKQVIEPKLNEYGLKGMELPTKSFVKFRNVDIQLGWGYFIINLDLF